MVTVSRISPAALPACVLGAALLLAFAEPASAIDRDEELFIRPSDQRTVGFASFDVGRSVFVTVGAKQTLVGPLDRTGFVAMESAGFGITQERSRIEGASLPATRFATQAASLVGYQWTFPGLYIASLVGPELDHEQLTVAGQIARVSQPRFGARGQIEVWANPSRDTMLTETLVAGSTRGSLYSRTSAGYRVAGDLYAGPEVTLYATDTYREIKWGGHLTGLDVGLVHLRASGGWMTSDDHRPGSPYIGLTAWIRM